MNLYAAFLRGINVGGHNIIKMAGLAALFSELGFGNVFTLLQSGNVVFSSSKRGANVRDIAVSSGVGEDDRIAARVEEGITARFGLDVPVVVCSIEELRAAVDFAPFTPDQLKRPNRALIYFFKKGPRAGMDTLGTATVDTDADRESRFQTGHDGSERVTLTGGRLYVYYPDGLGRSTFDSARIQRLLGTTATGRNWTTVAKVLARCEQTEREAV